MARNQNSRFIRVPAPIGGWNARDPLSAMPPTDAVLLDNWIPGTDGVSLRPGYTAHATGLGTTVQSLMEYSAPSGGLKLFGAAGTSIYDVTSAGAVGAAAVTSTTNALWSHVNFGTSAGNFLVCANGATAVRNYNGSSWSSPTINNVTSADLIYVAVHAERLWFIEKQSLSAWYLPVSAISGDATEFPIHSMCKLGGSLVALISWTRDGGSGSDDVFVFVTSKGEVVLYSGTDPSSASTWQRVGVFRIPEPVGRRCVTKVGADVGIITSKGVMALSSILPLASTDTAKIAVTDKIGRAFEEYYNVAGSLNGWELVQYPKRGWVFVNVPLAGGTSFYQALMNSGAPTLPWCRMTGIPAVCWSLLGDGLYFGSTDGKVYLFDQDYLDNGVTPITADAIPAFSDFGTPGYKRFLHARPLFTAAEGTDPPIEIKTDYDTSPIELSQATIPSGGSPWDTSPWDTSSWGPSVVVIENLQSVDGIGQVASPALSVTSQTPVTWHHTTIAYEPGGML